MSSASSFKFIRCIFSEKEKLSTGTVYKYVDDTGNYHLCTQIFYSDEWKKHYNYDDAIEVYIGPAKYVSVENTPRITQRDHDRHHDKMMNTRSFKTTIPDNVLRQIIKMINSDKSKTRIEDTSKRIVLMDDADESKTCSKTVSKRVVLMGDAGESKTCIEDASEECGLVVSIDKS